MSAEAKVRASWVWLDRETPDIGGYRIVIRHVPSEPASMMVIGEDEIYESVAWTAALAFTETRRKAIAEVDEEIRLLVLWGNMGFDTKSQVHAFNRILASRQAHRETLTRGMRQDKESQQ